MHLWDDASPWTGSVTSTVRQGQCILDREHRDSMQQNCRCLRDASAERNEYTFGCRFGRYAYSHGYFERIGCSTNQAIAIQLTSCIGLAAERQSVVQGIRRSTCSAAGGTRPVSQFVIGFSAPRKV